MCLFVGATDSSSPLSVTSSHSATSSIDVHACVRALGVGLSYLTVLIWWICLSPLEPALAELAEDA